MPDPIFAHPRLAALYDAFDHPRPDLVPYVALAGELGAHHVLDVGCGTGVLAALLAAEGYEVAGADPALASLGVARARPGTSAVTWLPVEAAQLPALGCDLAVMTGNVAQVFVTDEDWDAALRGLARAVRPGGHLVFETRRPEAEDWRTWSGPPQVRTVPGEGTVRTEFELLAAIPPLVTFRTVFTFADGERLTSESTLRFRGPAELRSSLLRHGFTVAEVREAPDRPGLEHVVIASRSASGGGVQAPPAASVTVSGANAAPLTSTPAEVSSSRACWT